MSTITQNLSFKIPRLSVQINLKTAALALGLFALFALGLAFVQYGTAALAGNDGYYHIKMGWLIRQQGLKPDFPWLPMTILNPEAYYNHHLLYHVYLSLFATADPLNDGGYALTQGAKIASIIMPSFAFLAIWWLLREQKVPYAAVWAIALLAISEAFLYRMSMPRAQSASLLILVLGLHWLLKEKYLYLLPLGFAYVWFYNAFPLLIVLAGFYFAAEFLLHRRLAWAALIYPTAGIILGIIINPYFPENVTFIVNHLLPKIGDSAVKVGNEWTPYRTQTLLDNSGFALALFVLGTLALGWRGKRIDRATLTALLLAFAFGFLLMRSRRFVEYFPPFALIFAALSARPLLAQWRESRPLARFLLPIALILLLSYPLYATLNDARDALGRSKPADQYAAALLWLHANADPNSTIFQTDWDDFTRLFFYNTDAIYLAGLDPTYTQLYDAALYDEWVDITRGRVENPSDAIRTRFGADYVFSDLKHGRFVDAAAEDPNLEEIYRDEYAVIFALKN